MSKKQENKTFAFALATQAKEESNSTKWKARDGVSVAGCTQYGRFATNLRYRSGGSRGTDTGYYC